MKTWLLFLPVMGDEKGIMGRKVIQPEPFYKLIRERGELKNVVVVLGQCYAGVFNYTNARAYRDKETGEQLSPNMIVLGATNLHESISTPFTGTSLCGDRIWVANTFLAFFFGWIRDPRDIDGDGRYSVTDAFKYAAIFSNRLHKKAKGLGVIEGLVAYDKFKEVGQSLDSNPKNEQLNLELKSLAKVIENELDTRFVHQESWILNVEKARELEF